MVLACSLNSEISKMEKRKGRENNILKQQREEGYFLKHSIDISSSLFPFLPPSFLCFLGGGDGVAAGAGGGTENLNPQSCIR